MLIRLSTILCIFDCYNFFIIFIANVLELKLCYVVYIYLMFKSNYTVFLPNIFKAEKGT